MEEGGGGSDGAGPARVAAASAGGRLALGGATADVTSQAGRGSLCGGDIERANGARADSAADDRRAKEAIRRAQRAFLAVLETGWQGWDLGLASQK